MKEATLKKNMRKAWKPCHLTTIEGMNTFGMPDCHVSSTGHKEWIELKQNYSGKLYFRANQLVWMMQELRNGVDTWIMWHNGMAFAVRYSILRNWDQIIGEKRITVIIYNSDVYTSDLVGMKEIIFPGVYK